MVARHAQHHVAQCRVGQDPAARPIGADRAPLAPGRQRARQPLAGRIQLRDALDAPPGLLGIGGKGAGGVELRHFLLEPAPASELLQPFGQALAQRQQVAHVVERVGELCAA